MLALWFFRLLALTTCIHSFSKPVSSVCLHVDRWINRCTSSCAWFQDAFGVRHWALRRGAVKGSREPPGQSQGHSCCAAHCCSMAASASAATAQAPETAADANWGAAAAAAHNWPEPQPSTKLHMGASRLQGQQGPAAPWGSALSGGITTHAAPAPAAAAGCAARGQ